MLMVDADDADAPLNAAVLTFFCISPLRGIVLSILSATRFRLIEAIAAWQAGCYAEHKFQQSTINKVPTWLCWFPLGCARPYLSALVRACPHLSPLVRVCSPLARACPHLFLLVRARPRLVVLVPAWPSSPAPVRPPSSVLACTRFVSIRCCALAGAHPPVLDHSLHLVALVRTSASFWPCSHSFVVVCGSFRLSALISTCLYYNQYSSI
jgi:hypothetical protein